MSTTSKLSSALETIQEELETAKVVQCAFLPQEHNPVNGVKTFGLYLPSAILGGDLYDIIAIHDNALGLVILDVAGHGVAAALISAMAKLAFTREVGLKHSPGEIFAAVNTELVKHFPVNIYLTAFVGILDVSTGKFVYSSAGHPPSMHICKELGTVEYLKTPRPNTFIGLLPDQKYCEGIVTLSKGDKIVMYTDGLTECMNVIDEQFGRPRLAEILKTHYAMSGAELLEVIKNEYQTFNAGQSQQDDITLLVSEIV
jgi:sigma-B regulation protein RsbU (phosphoserine phosphatase)